MLPSLYLISTSWSLLKCNLLSRTALAYGQLVLVHLGGPISSNILGHLIKFSILNTMPSHLALLANSSMIRTDPPQLLIVRMLINISCSMYFLVQKWSASHSVIFYLVIVLYSFSCWSHLSCWYIFISLFCCSWTISLSFYDFFLPIRTILSSKSSISSRFPHNIS